MLVQDMINIPRESLPVIFCDLSKEKLLRIFSTYPYVFLPVTDKKMNLVGVVKREDMEKDKGLTSADYLDGGFPCVVESENAMKLRELFNSEEETDILFVVDRDGMLLGAVTNSNPALGQIAKVTSFIPLPEIFDAMHDAIIIIDSTATIVYANHAYAELLGVPIWKIVGKKMSRVEPTSRCLGVLQGNAPLVNERIKIKSLGVQVIASITPIYQGNTMVGVVSVFRGIDETIKLSRKIEQMEYINRYLKSQLELKSKLPTAFEAIVGKNGRFVDALSLGAKVATSNANVIIRGENGTGKEVLANAIHNASGRGKYPMIKVNCAAIPEPLLESELFGYEEGAFTGAQKGGKIGKFELADKGTIFLDEIGDMALSMQAKVLRVIQEKQVERVGGNTVIDVNVRIISATNKNLEKMVTEGTFREDLYYRLNVVSVMLPPLRERKDDISLLAEHFADVLASETGKQPLRFSKEVMDVFMAYDWKGNIRELQNIIEHAAVVCSGENVDLRDLPRYLIDTTYDTENPKLKKAEVSDLNQLVRNIEREAIIKALKKYPYNKSAAIRILGISRRTFYKKLKDYKIELPL